MSRFHKSCIPAFVAAVLLTTPDVVPAQTTERVVNIVLEDQFRSRRETGRFRGDVVVLVYADRRGAEKSLALGRRLHLVFHPTAERAPAAEWSNQPVIAPPGWPTGVRPPEVRVVPVACMPEVPRPLEAVARSRMRTDSPHVPVWLDFEGVMEQVFGMEPGAPNVAVLDLDGRTASVQTGRFDELEFRELVVEIDRIRMRSRPDLRTAGASAPLTR